MIEYLIIKSFLNKSIFDRYSGFIKEISNKELQRVFYSLKHLHNGSKESYSVSELELVFLAEYPMLKEAEKQKYEIIFKRIEEAGADNTLIENYLKSLRERELSRRIAVEALEVSEGRKDISSVIELTKQLEVGVGISEEIETLPTSLNELMDEYDSTPGFKWRLNCLNQSLGYFRKGTHGHIFARVECIAEDEVVRIKYHPNSDSSKKLTMKAFYKRFNGKHHLKGEGPYQIQATTPEGNVYYTDVEHVTYSGKKEVFKVTTARGFSVKASAEHEFLLSDGTYKKLSLLKVGDSLRTDRTERQQRLAREERAGTWEGSPYSKKMVGKHGPYHRARLHRLVYDAGLNGLSVEEFINELNLGKANSLKFSDQSLDIHHKNMNHNDNRFENLELLTRGEHTTIHLLARDVGASRHADPDGIVSIVPCGEMDCYDIGVAGENKNFRASGIFVHNCGKTAMWISELTYMVQQMKDDEVACVFFNEEDGKGTFLRIYCAMLGKTEREVLANREQSQKEFDEKGGWRIKFLDRPSLTKKFIEDALEKFKPALCIIDNADKIKGFDADRKDLSLANIYKWLRELAKTYCPLISIGQADATAHNRRWVDEAQMADSKTGKPSETDFALGIGKTSDEGMSFIRHIYISRNKCKGGQETIPELRHGKFDVLIKPELSIYEDLLQ